MILRNLAHITHSIYIFTGTAAGTSNGHEPTAAYQGSSWGATIHSHVRASWRRGLRCRLCSHTKCDLSHIITHHYSSLHNSLLIITHHYSNRITHHYAPLHYLRWVKHLLRWCLKISCHKTLHTRPLRMKIEGGGWPPPRFFCVMMSKKENYE